MLSAVFLSAWATRVARGLGAATLVLCSLWVWPAGAQPSEADRATARALATEGYHALEKRDYQTAEDRFRRADALVHAPSLVVDHARALAGLGRLVEAYERYQLVVREGVAPGAPARFRRALADADRELKALEPRLAWLTITIVGPSAPAVLVDGRAVPPAALGVRRATDPGTRRISATAPGYLPADAEVSLPEGGERQLTLELKPDPNANRLPAAAPIPVAPPNAGLGAPAPKRPSNAVAYVSLGLGGAGLIVGAVTGGLFLDKRSELESKCPDASNCQQPHLISQYNRYGTISGIGLGVGVVGTVAGVWLLLAHRGREAPPAPPKPVAVLPYVSVGHLGVQGAF